MIPIIRKEIADALRNRWLLGYAVAMAVLGIAASWLGLRTSGALAFQMFGRTAATLTNLILILSPLVALVVGSTSLAGERDRGTMPRLLALPIHPRELVLGKYLGLLAALSGATLVGFVPSAIVIGIIAGAASLPSFLLFPAVALLLVAAMLAVGVFVSAIAENGLKALGAAVFLWFAFVLLYDLLLIGTLTIAAVPAKLLAGLLAANPIDAARVLVVLMLEADLYSLGPAGVALTGFFGEKGAMLLLVGVIVTWTAMAVVAAPLAFTRNISGRSGANRAREKAPGAAAVTWQQTPAGTAGD